MGRKYRYRSPDNVIYEIEFLQSKYGINYFDINDDSFNFKMDRAEAICDLIIKKNIKIKLNMANGIRADRVNERLLRKMKDAGCAWLQYGAESGNMEIFKK